MHKLLITFIFIFISNFSFAQYPSQNVTLLSTWDSIGISSEPFYGIRYAGCWGWHDGNGHEYAIIGSTEGYHVVEVTNPTAPVQRAFIPGCVNQAIWREIKTYENYVYCVSDDGGSNCMIIADLSYLPDSVHVVHRSNSIIERSHTIFVEGNKLYANLVHGGSISGASASMAVYSLANPELPVKLREFNQDVPNITVVHDAIAVNDTVYASCGFEGLYIAKFDTVLNQFNLINTVTTYPQQGYNHATAITGNHKTLIITDEVPTGLPLKAFDIADVMNISFPSVFASTPTTTATPHNPFMLDGDKLIVAYYQDGLQIFDLSNPSSPALLGYLDTNPTDGAGLPNPAYSGCWGAYVDLPSGNILASDMQNGLFVINISQALGLNESQSFEFNVNVFPNPCSDFVELHFTAIKNETITVLINDVNGKTIVAKNFDVKAGSNVFRIPLSDFSNGVYIINANNENHSVTKRMIKID